MKEWFVRLAGKFVNNIEQTELEWLEHMAEMYQQKGLSRHMGGCGCFQCRKAADRWMLEYLEEKARLTGWHSDHEEDLIADWALQKLNDIKQLNSGDSNES